jgi:hypothetical protein
MIDYYFTEIKGSETESIKKSLIVLCKENNIYQERQDYKILFNKEKVFEKNNDVIFTSGSKKYLCFYGKIYLNKNNKIIETIYSNGHKIIIEPSKDSILIIVGGIENSTNVENQEDILYFYIAPSHLLELQDPTKWEDI